MPTTWCEADAPLDVRQRLQIDGDCFGSREHGLECASVLAQFARHEQLGVGGGPRGRPPLPRGRPASGGPLRRGMRQAPLPAGVAGAGFRRRGGIGRSGHVGGKQSVHRGTSRRLNGCWAFPVDTFTLRYVASTSGAPGRRGAALLVAPGLGVGPERRLEARIAGRRRGGRCRLQAPSRVTLPPNDEIAKHPTACIRRRLGGRVIRIGSWDFAPQDVCKQLHGHDRWCLSPGCAGWRESEPFRASRRPPDG